MWLHNGMTGSTLAHNHIRWPSLAGKEEWHMGAVANVTPHNRTSSGKFVKGMSGNPGGRPSQPQEFRELLEKHSTTALQKVIEILQDPKTQAKDKIRAAEIILDRTFGRPVQQNINDNINHAMEDNDQTRERLKKILEDLRQ